MIKLLVWCFMPLAWSSPSFASSSPSFAWSSPSFASSSSSFAASSPSSPEPARSSAPSSWSSQSSARSSQPDSSITLATCYQLAEANYPLTKQRGLIAKTNAYTLENIAKGVYPQLAVNGTATYQSDVTKISVPGYNIPAVSKDQYKIYGEVSQTLTDFGINKQKRELSSTDAALQEENLNTELYKLKDRVNQLFFGALLIDGQLQQNELSKADIRTGIAKVQAAIANGTDYNSSLNKLKAELLKTEQHSIDLRASRKAYTDMLSLFLGFPVTETTTLVKPDPLYLSSPTVSSSSLTSPASSSASSASSSSLASSSSSASLSSPALASSSFSPVGAGLTDSITRPELRAYDLQAKYYQEQRHLTKINNYPQLNAFFQGGLGKPSPVNFLSKELSGYYLTGLRLTWNIGGLYTYKRDQLINKNNQDLVASQRSTFIFNTSLTLRQQNADIDRYRQLMQSDDEIIKLRESVKQSSAAQLANGVISTNDYLTDINAEAQARQDRVLHEVQMLISQYNRKTTSGN